MEEKSMFKNCVFKPNVDTIKWIKPSEHLSYQIPEKPFEISEEDWKRFSYVTSIVGDEYLHSSLSRVMKILESYRNGRIGQ